jgi:mRNA-degrading endonuclease RelE of RelBE toxin-antitoxin system
LSYRLELLPEARDDIHALPAALRREVVRLLVALEQNPYLGREMWVVRGFETLTDCRSLKLDTPDRKAKPRYRLVYRNEPNEGAIAIVCVLTVGERKQMTAYKQARARLRSRLRQQD